jgi:hypothetical protein
MAAVDYDWPKSQRAFERLANECDEFGLGEALMAWTGTVIAHVSGGTWDGTPLRVVPMAIETGELGGELEPAKQWAMDLIRARAASGPDEFARLLAVHSAIEDGFERGRWASALVEICAHTIRSVPSGIARLGRPV